MTKDFLDSYMGGENIHGGGVDMSNIMTKANVRRSSFLFSFFFFLQVSALIVDLASPFLDYNTPSHMPGPWR